MGLSILSMSSSCSKSSSSFSILGFEVGCVSGGKDFGGETGESSLSPSSTWLRPFTPDGCLDGGVLLDGLRTGDDKSSGRLGFSPWNGLRRPKCLSDKKDRDSEVRTKCSNDDREVLFAPDVGTGKPEFIIVELVVEETDEGLDGSSSLSSLSSWSIMSGLGELPKPGGRCDDIPGNRG